MTDFWSATRARDNWVRARRKATWAAIMDVLARRPGELLPLEEVRSRLNVRGSHYRGLQEVPLDRIVGSEGRYVDFDRRFLPRSEHDAQRWQNIDRAQMSDVHLPPVELYKIGDVYFVKDGNHRVSVARQNGRVDIDAYVTELDVDVPLDPSVSMENLLLKEEWSDFLDWTQLARLRPDQRIELSALGGYLDLINHINTHRYYMALERNSPVSAEEAVTSWYDHVYKPVVEAIRRHQLLAHFPGRTEADLYLWIMQHRRHLREIGGQDPGPEAATLDYLQRLRQRSVLGAVAGAAHTISDAAVRVLSDAVRATTGRSETPSNELLDFIAWSRLDAVCPDTEIRFSEPRNYRRLRELLEEHQVQLNAYLKRPASLEEAVRDWCTHFYDPTVAAIREQQLLAAWPGRTVADLYLEAVEQVRRSDGPGVPAVTGEAVASLHERDGEDSIVARLVRGARWLLRWQTK